MIAVDTETRETLVRFGFDEELFEALRAKVAVGRAVARVERRPR